MSPAAVCVSLRIERVGETINGQIAVENGPSSSFFGWLELIGRLDKETAALDRTGGQGGSR